MQTDVMKDIDSVLSHVQFSRQEALLYVFDHNEAVIKMIIKGKSPTMRHVPRTHRVALDWVFDRIDLDSKIIIKYIDINKQLADMLTKGDSTRDEWNHLLCLFKISHFSPIVNSGAMQKRFQQDSGEERVTAKPKLMMNLIARTSSVVSSSPSLSPRKRYYENKILGDLLLQMIDHDLLINSLQQIIQNWIMTFFFKSGKVSLRHTIDQEILIKFFWYTVH